MWQFVLNWRYLLLAMVVLLGEALYLFVYLPRSCLDSPAGQDPITFRDSYQRIVGGMTEEQVKDILGPPNFTSEMDASSIWFCRINRRTAAGCGFFATPSR